jgi:hypothetical protein
LVSEAAASTVARLPGELVDVAGVAAALRELVAVLLLLPHPVANVIAEAQVANTTADILRPRAALTTRPSSSTSCQDPGSIP